MPRHALLRCRPTALVHKVYGSLSPEKTLKAFGDSALSSLTTRAAPGHRKGVIPRRRLVNIDCRAWVWGKRISRGGRILSHWRQRVRAGGRRACRPACLLVVLDELSASPRLYCFCDPSAVARVCVWGGGCCGRCVLSICVFVLVCVLVSSVCVCVRVLRSDYTMKAKPT